MVVRHIPWRAAPSLKPTVIEQSDELAIEVRGLVKRYRGGRGPATVAGVDVRPRPRRGAPAYRRGVARSKELLSLVGLADAADRLIGTCAGGMKRRLDLATALVHEPAVLFLDEPTTGLDPASRRRRCGDGVVNEILLLSRCAVREVWRMPAATIPTLFIPVFFPVVNLGQVNRIFASPTPASPSRSH